MTLSRPECDQLVIQKSNGEWSHCIKGLGHPSDEHEDYLGNTVVNLGTI